MKPRKPTSVSCGLRARPTAPATLQRPNVSTISSTAFAITINITHRPDTPALETFNSGCWTFVVKKARRPGIMRYA